MLLGAPRTPSTPRVPSVQHSPPAGSAQGDKPQTYTAARTPRVALVSPEGDACRGWQVPGRSQALGKRRAPRAAQHLQLVRAIGSRHPNARPATRPLPPRRRNPPSNATRPPSFSLPERFPLTVLGGLHTHIKPPLGSTARRHLQLALCS